MYDPILDKYLKKSFLKAFYVFLPFPFLAFFFVSHNQYKFDSTELKLIISAVFAFAAGIVLFLWGWECFNRKRCIEGVPTSKIRSLAMGIVELKGKTLLKHDIRTPFSNMACVLYKFLKEKRICYQTKHGKSYKWVTIDEGTSITPFYVEDTTGKVLVEPLGIDIYMDRRYFKSEGDHEGALRYGEWFFLPGEDIYLIGKAGKSAEVRSEKKTRLFERLDKLKNDKVEMSKLDTNKDGAIDSMEWEIACQRIENELKAEEARKETDSLADVAIAAGINNEPFIISDRSEKDLVKGLTIKSAAGIFGGLSASLGSLYFLLSMFQIW